MNKMHYTLMSGILLFGLTMNTPAGVLLVETFDYPDGNLETNSAGRWVLVAGTNFHINVQSNAYHYDYMSGSSSGNTVEYEANLDATTMSSAYFAFDLTVSNKSRQ